MDKKVDAILVCNMREKYPCMTLKQIGDEFGICRERVRQLLKRENMITGQYKPPYICKQCGIMFHTSKLHRSKKYCSNKCSGEWILQHKSKPIIVKCNNCGKEFEMTQKIYNQHISVKSNRNIQYSGDRFYCNRKCFGQWLGNNHGKHSINVTVNKVKIIK